MKEGSSKYEDGYYMCSVCKVIKELDNNNFYKNKHKKTGYSTECKPCKLKYQKVRNKMQRELRKSFIKSKNFMCQICEIQNFDTSFFDIDHIIPVVITKEARSLPSFYDGRFQVLCPNCHRIKTINEYRTRKEE